MLVRLRYGDADVAAGSAADAAMQTAVNSADEGGTGITPLRLFFLSVAAGVTVWLITGFARPHVFGKGS